MPFKQEGDRPYAEFHTPCNDINYYHNPTPLIAHLNPVLDAAYNCGPRAGSICFHDTRVQVLQNIDNWSRSPGDRHLSLLDGPAGFGKSAIARTVAEQWDRSKRLAGTFFFFRNSGDQSKIIRLVSTLAYHLTRYVPETTQSIENALIEDASLLKQPIEQQFQKLIINPVVALPKQSHRRMIVIDALDECEDRESIRQLIEFFTRIDYSKFPIDIFFTSRREEHIRRIFESSPFSRTIYQISLSNTAFGVHGDIEHFLRSQFNIIYQENPRLMGNIPSPWPSPSDLDEIVWKVNGSFIFASTLTRYISEGREPPQRLKLIVERHNGVDEMYTEIVEQFWGNEHFRIVFSTIMLLHRPLSVMGLASLLDLTIPDILIEIFKIQSILLIPADNSTPVDVVHKSLRDFSVSKERSGAMFVNTPQNQLITAKRCLKVMSTESGVVGFEGEAAKYAFEHWHGHLLLTLEDPDFIYLQEHPDTLTSIGNLASMYSNFFSQRKEAEQPNVQVLETRKRVLGEEHPDTLTSMANLALTYLNQGRWKEAEQLDVQVSGMRKRILDLNEAIVRRNIPEQAPEPLSYSIDLAEVTDSPDIPEHAPEPLSYFIDLAEVTDSPDVPERAPEPLSYSIDPAEVTDIPDVPEQALGPLSYSIDSVRVTDSPGIPEQAPEPLSYSIDLAEVADTDIPE